MQEEYDETGEEAQEHSFIESHKTDEMSGFVNITERHNSNSTRN